MTRKAIAAATMLSLTTPAAAEPFTLLIYETSADLELRAEAGAAGAAYWRGYADFAAAATEAGILRGGSALDTDPAGTATVSAVDAAGGLPVLPALALGGYFQIEVADRAAALDWAAKLPAASSGAVEIRTGYPSPSM